MGDESREAAFNRFFHLEGERFRTAVEDSQGVIVGVRQGLLHTAAADEHMGTGLKVGVNKGIRSLLTSRHGLLVGNKLTMALKQINRVERLRPGGRGKHLAG